MIKTLTKAFFLFLRHAWKILKFPCLIHSSLAIKLFTNYEKNARKLNALPYLFRVFSDLGLLQKGHPSFKSGVFGNSKILIFPFSSET